MNHKKYTSDLLKGTGLIQETLLLLNLYTPNMPKDQMTKNAIESNLLVKASNMRIKDIVEIVFYKRYVNEDSSVPINLKIILSHNLSLDLISQLLLIYTSRTNLILKDFIIDVYWPEVKKGVKELDFTYARKFIAELIKQSESIIGWSDSTQRRVASHMISTLVDFRFLDKHRSIKPVFLNDITANYLAHELHFSGFSDNDIVDNEEWKIFGYSKFETIKHLERLSFQGHFIMQNSGEILKINWIYKNMGDFVNAIG